MVTPGSGVYSNDIDPNPGEGMNSAVLALALLAPTAPSEPAAPDVRANVRSGLKWLAAQQKADGTWEAANGFSRTTATAVAGLALLMEGSTPGHGPYAPHLRKALAWLEKHAAKDGRLASTDETEMFQYVTSHAQALLFLACAYDADGDRERRVRLAPLLERGVAFAVECQTPRGGWGFVRPAPGADYDDGLSTATVLQAILAARKAGIEVPRKATDKAVQYLVRSSNPDGGIIYSSYGEQVPRGNDGMPTISSAAAAGVLTADGPRPFLLPAWVTFGNRDAVRQLQYLATNTSGVIMYQFHAARAAYALGENGHRALRPDAPAAEVVRWSTYRATAFKALTAAQAKDGSWPDQTFGPQYTTALALIVLQLDNDYLPAFSR